MRAPWITEPASVLEHLVERGGGPESCHLWLGKRTKGGYARFKSGGQWVYVHRWLVGARRGRPLAAREVARHRCDNPPCVNPRHLVEGAQADNNRDARERGRADLSGLELGREPGKTLGVYRVGTEQCGTVRGYNRHRRQGEPTCSSCRAAAATYNQERRAVRGR